MKTLVFQSHADRPPYWISLCTQSVRAWVETHGFDYRLLGDELFSGIPAEITVKSPSVLPLTDLGRLLWTQRFLDEGYERVVWVDSDVLVFDPENFCIDGEEKHYVCREIVTTEDKGKLVTRLSFNPSVLVFRAQSPLLKKWVDRSLEVGRKSKRLTHTSFGRELLKEISGRNGPPALTNIGHFDMALVYEIAGEPLPKDIVGNRIGLMMKTSGEPFAAANLCAHIGKTPAIHLKAVETLLETRGAVVNDRLPAGA